MAHVPTQKVVTLAGMVWLGQVTGMTEQFLYFETNVGRKLTFPWVTVQYVEELNENIIHDESPPPAFIASS